MKKRMGWVLVFLMIPSFAAAGDISLPPDLRATAFIAKAVRDGFWEKSLVVRFPERRRVLSTKDGFVDVLAVVNHSADPALWKKVCREMRTKEEVGGKIYSRQVKEKTAVTLGLKGADVAQMSTAADMNHLAVVTKTFTPFTVTAMVTAGAKTNALRTGLDAGRSVEGEEPKGTVNILILTNARLTDGAMARAIVTATEAKTAAFQDLNVPSSRTKNAQATGTGTDSVIVVAGVAGPRVTYTGGHSRIGELMGKAVYEAVVEALGKQNGFRRPGR